jgi:hypothetical protein
MAVCPRYTDVTALTPPGPVTAASVRIGAYNRAPVQFAVCCLLSAVCCLLSAVCCLLSVALPVFGPALCLPRFLALLRNALLFKFVVGMLSCLPLLGAADAQ